MTTVLLDVMWGFAPGDSPKSMSMTGGIAWREPGYTPSPRLLRAGQLASADKHDVRLVCLTEKEAQEPAEALAARLGACDHVIITAPALYRAASQRLAQAVKQSGVSSVTLLDPWAEPGESGESGESATGLHGYGFGTGVVAGQAEVDVAPGVAPVHPWVVPAASSAPAASWQARLDEAVRSLTGAAEARVYLNDDRVPLDLARLTTLAETVSRTIKEQDTLLELHLRAWPADLGADDKLLDYLTLLPLGSLDVLIGSLNERSLDRPGRTGSLADVEKVIARINERGLSHLASLSIALALPGETAEDVVEGLNRAISAAARARIRRIRFALWLGDGVAMPTDSADQDRLFLASHPDWHPLEYRGIFDFVSLMRTAAPQLTLVGPGLVAGWEPPADLEASEASEEQDAPR